MWMSLGVELFCQPHPVSEGLADVLLCCVFMTQLNSGTGTPRCSFVLILKLTPFQIHWARSILVSSINRPSLGINRPSLMDDFGEANGSFAITLLKMLGEEYNSQNVFFSPLSISSALAMVFMGAKGDTAAQMSQVGVLPQWKNNAWFSLFPQGWSFHICPR